MKRKLWDIEEFNKVNLPEVIGQISNKEAFSKFNNIRVLDMPIYMPGQGWGIPNDITQFLEPIELACKSEERFGNFFKDHYVYITVDQKVVEKGNTGRRAGAHSDAYIESKLTGNQIDLTFENADIIKQEEGEVSHTYIVTDIFPTEFFDAKFPLEKTDCDSAMQTFDEIAKQSKVITYPTYTLLRLDPFIVHQAAIATETARRTFVKISFSRKQYNREGNTHNDLFDYNWKMAKRKEKRNHPWS